MKKLIKDKTGWMHVYLIRPMVILLCLSLVFAPVPANALPRKTDDGGDGGGGGPTLEEKINMAKAGLLEIQAGQITNYFPDHDSYFFANGISEINSALAVGLNEAYIDYRAGDNPQILGQADIKGTDIGFRIEDTGEPYLYNGTLPGEVPAFKTAGSFSVMSDQGFAGTFPIRSSPVIANLDSDPEGELIVADYNGDVYAWDYTGGSWTGLLQSSGLFAHTDAGSPIRGTPAIANIDKDVNGIMEVAVGNSSGKVYVWHVEDVSPVDGLADLMPGFPVQALTSAGTNGNIDNSIVLDDINNDTNLEIIAADTNGGVNIWDNAGGRIGSVFGYASIVNSSPAVGDIDKDGFSEIITAHSTRICAWRYNGTGFINNTPPNVGKFFDRPSVPIAQGYFNSSPVLADIDGDGILEVVAVTSLAYIYALDEDASYVDSWPDATQVWPKRLGVTNATSSVAIGNIANYTGAGFSMYNNDLEMVVGAHNGNIYALHHDGKPVAGWPVDRTNDAMTTSYDSSPALADIDNDGDIEVIIGCWNGNLYGYHHDDQSLPADNLADPVAGFPKTGMGRIELSSPSIGFLDNPNELRIAIADLSGVTHIWNLANPSTNMPWPKFRHDLKNTGTYLRPDRVIPIIDPVTPAPVEVGNPVNFTVQARDFGVDPLDVIDISAYNKPAGATFTFNDLNNSGDFSWTPATTGSYTVSFIATDYYGLHSTKLNVGITVDPSSNQPPVANNDTANTNEDVAVVVNVLANDSDPQGLGDIDPSSVVITQDPTNGTITNINATNGEVTYQPNTNYFGSDIFRYKVNDYHGAQSVDPASVTVTIASVDDAPTLDIIADQTMDEGQVLPVNLYASDPEGNGITLSYESVPVIGFGALVDNLNGTGTLTFSPGFNDAGVYAITVTATAAGLTDSKSFNLTVNDICASNTAPNISDVVDITTPEDTSLNNARDLWLYTTDVETPVSELIYTITDARPEVGVTIDSNRYLDVNPAPNWYGSSDVVVTVTDPCGLTSYDRMLVTVTSVDDAPLLDNIGSQSVDEGQVLSVPLHASDPESDAITLSYESVPVIGFGALVDNLNGTGTLTFSPGFNDASVYAITVTATAAGLSDTKPFTLTVNEASSAVDTVHLYDSADNLIDTFSQIQAAISDPRAVNGCKILVDPGTYTENINFLGKAITVKAAQGLDVGETIIDGGQAGSVVTFNSGEGAGSVLEGFKITNGRADSGAGIYCANSSPQIKNCVITNNQAVGTTNESGGGGIYCFNSSPLIINSTITNNTADAHDLANGARGGGIHCEQSSPVITGGTISNNSASKGAGAYFNNFSSPSITGTTFTANQAYWSGGGIYIRDNSSPTITNCAITYNTVEFTDSDGGGIDINWNSSPVITNCIITDNGSLSWNIGDNGSSGGGIHINGGSNPEIKNCLIARNYSTRGGGIHVRDGSYPTITNCTIAENKVNPIKYGGGINVMSSSQLQVLNTILWGNDLDEVHLLDATASLVINYTDVEGGYIGTYNINANPLFVGGGDYHLTALSPCLDTGSPDSPLDPDGTRADMGAYYFAHVAYQPPVASDNSYSINEDTILNVSAPGVLGNDVNNRPGSTLTSIKVSDPLHGTLVLNSNGSFDYTPATNYNGSDSFTYKANDGSLDSNIATVNIAIAPGNDIPVLDHIGNKSGNEGVLLQFDVYASDVDSDTLTINVNNNPSGSTLSPTTFNASIQKYQATFSWPTDFDDSGIYSNVIFNVNETP